jgi:hypothetical protein
VLQFLYTTMRLLEEEQNSKYSERETLCSNHFVFNVNVYEIFVSNTRFNF